MNRMIRSLLLAGMALLVACNGAEDFGGTIPGPVVPLPGGPKPIPGVNDDAVLVELVAAIDDNGTVRTATITNLGYTCTSSSAYMPKAGAREALARCHPSASSVEFFIGDRDDPAKRFSLGTYYLPMCTGRSTRNECAGGVGFFQAALSDLIPTKGPRRERADSAEVRNRAALLAALDDNPQHVTRIDISDWAHLLADQAPDPVLSQSSYDNFVNHWADWLALVSNALQPDQPLAFPSAMVAVDLASAAMSRVRTGTFVIKHDFTAYRLQLSEDALPPIDLEIPFHVMPDGRAVGIGRVLGRPVVNDDRPADLIALESLSFLSEQLQMVSDGNEEFWRSATVFQPVNGDPVFSGRLVGVALYDGLATRVDPSKTDYNMDYPATGAAALQTNDRGRFTGTVFSDSVNSAPFRAERTGFVSPTLIPAVMDALPEFYQITLFRPCVDQPDDCPNRPIPQDEYDGEFVGPVGNYSKAFTYQDPDTGEQLRFDIVREQPHNRYFNETFQIQILADGTVITDSNMNCSPVNNLYVDATGRQEYPVGYVSRSHDDDNGLSANLVLFMAGPAELGRSAELGQTWPRMPHYAARIEGRIAIDLPGMPFYRLSDENFSAGIRALWTDTFQSENYIREMGLVPPVTREDFHELLALSKGAAEGLALDGATCLPL
ncbi:MAG: hypothetical protein ACK4SX_05710 [Alcanivoracaceae bacterium]